MAGAVTSLSRQTGVQYWFMLAAALVATVGFFLCIFSVARVIKDVASTNKVRRLQLSILLYPAAIGALLSAKVSLWLYFSPGVQDFVCGLEVHLSRSNSALLRDASS